MSRLNRESVERQIVEMWDTLSQGPGTDEAEGDLDQAKRDAAECEKRLRARLNAQDRLDDIAPAMLSFIREMESYLVMKLDGWRRVDKLPENHAIILTAVRYLETARLLIAKAEGKI